MRWVEIISLRCPGNVNTRFVNELLKEVNASDTPKHLVEIRMYHHSVVETDLSIHIHWKSEPGSQMKSPLGLRVSSALKELGLLNHSVWIEKAALEAPLCNGNSNPPDIRTPEPDQGQYHSDRAENPAGDEILSIMEKQKNGKILAKKGKPIRGGLE